MHSVRTKARRAAWSLEGDTPNYNPFARTRSNDSRRAEDEENRLGRVRSETHLEPTIAEHRRAESRQAEQDFPGPHHADTAPPTSATSEKPPLDLGEDRRIVNGESSSPLGTSKQSGDTSDTLVPAPKKGLRNRMKFRNILRKNTEEDDEGLQRTDSATSERSVKRKAALARKIPAMQQFRAVAFGSWINVLLIMVPVGFIVNYLKINGIAVFVVNFIAIVPLAAMLSYATEELALRTGETLGGLLNATFGNAVELIVSIQALFKDEIIIVKTSLIGSMLSNLLLVLGMCFFFGGISRLEQHFNITVAQTAASLLALSIGSLIIPTVFHSMISSGSTDTRANFFLNQELSHGTAIILLIVYACYLFFQLKSHASMYNEPSKKTEKRKKSGKVDEGAASRGIAQIGAGTAAAAGGNVNLEQLVQEGDDDDEHFEEPQLTMLGALVTLAASTTMVAFCSEFMVDNIQSVTEGGGVSTVFVGLILLPIVGNAAEHATAVTVAVKDKMDLAIGVAVGSSMQIALLVLPFIVVVGWIAGKECMTLYFDNFQIAVLFISILLVNYLIQDGKSHWLEGVLLMATYMIIAIAGWFYPSNFESDSRCLVSKSGKVTVNPSYAVASSSTVATSIASATASAAAKYLLS